MPGDKRSFEERLPHVLAVEKLLCSGAREAAIIRALGAEFGLTAKQVRQDIAAVRRRWAKKKCPAGDRIGSAFGMALARRDRLYYLAVKSGDIRLALAVLIDHDKLLGLYPRRTVVVLPPRTAAGMTDAELERIARTALVPPPRAGAVPPPRRPADAPRRGRVPQPRPATSGRTRHHTRRRSGGAASAADRRTARPEPEGCEGLTPLPCG